MKIKGNSSNFEPCVGLTGKAVCVDATPLRKQQSQFGERDVFRLVFEVDAEKDDGTRYCVWSRGFTPSLNEKANFRKFVRAWFGRDLSREEMENFDTESLVGKPAQVVVIHEHKDGETYANIAACTADKSGEPLKASGKYVRVKDRPPKDGAEGQSGGLGGYRRAEQPASGTSDHASVKVHIGKYQGHELRDLSPDAVVALAEKWLPGAKTSAKPTADDRRLIAALEWWLVSQEKANDDLPY